MILCSSSFSERRRKWKEELDQELERQRGNFIHKLLDYYTTVLLVL
jgi:hypothetical protein